MAAADTMAAAKAIETLFPSRDVHFDTVIVFEHQRRTFIAGWRPTQGLWRQRDDPQAFALRGHRIQPPTAITVAEPIHGVMPENVTVVDATDPSAGTDEDTDATTDATGGTSDAVAAAAADATVGPDAAADGAVAAAGADGAANDETNATDTTSTTDEDGKAVEPSDALADTPGEEDDGYDWVVVVDSFTDSQGWIYGTGWDRIDVRRYVYRLANITPGRRLSATSSTR